MKQWIFLILVCTIAQMAAPAASGQTAPTRSEIDAFDPLMRAAYSGTADDLRSVLAAGADVNQRDANGRTAAHVAAFASNDRVLPVLAAAGIDMNALDAQLYDVVTIAAVANDAALVELAIGQGNRADLITSVYEGTALIAAAHLGHYEVVQVLVDNDAPLDHVNNLGWTALIEAVVLGDGGPDHVETLRILLQAGSNRAIPDRDGLTPLDHARARGYREMVDLLVSR